MNHLAHVFLAPDSPEARIGSVMGDFARGLQVRELPPTVRVGIHHHRAVDSFTDSHPDVLASKRLFSRQRRRFAGVALDILYDHYLLRHWQGFSNVDSDTFIATAYQEFRDYEYLMPDKMKRVTRNMVENDWFGTYADLDSVGFALNRVAQRIRFQHQFFDIIDEIKEHDRELERRFLTFFPDLIKFAGEVS
ncbi:ACP phosphodiesterase [uncultured Marinobacter sp.]|uniref:acyl carrier protein phosphodiesterase n=1 Tax=uncultured Marinobacter sp. TaxID=187379 RepID=UPI00261D4623|nr:ACP phosphodiesterase [uncultured Marinobacter sp.]